MALTDVQQREAATNFSNYWRRKGDEKSDCQRFWIDFIQDVLGIEEATQKIVFEKRVNVDGQTKFIDVYIPETRTLIEQKSVDKDLSKKYQQSGGVMMTPYEQGRRYSQFLPVDEAARWIIACNFKTFEIHDMNKPQDTPVVIELDEVRHKLPLFDFMFTKEVKELSHEMEISVKAGEIVGFLYDKLLAQYKDPTDESLKSLNALCVRLVFCLYAEDAGIFDKKNRSMFHDYFQDVDVTAFRKTLVEFFKILDTKECDRDKYLAEDNPKLAAFPYVNGGLFADETIEIPPFTEEIKTILLQNASADFDWSEISPTIFGAVFESTLNPETRRAGGMHYTSIENIHKVIDPLFMDEINAEYNEIAEISIAKDRNKKLDALQKKLAGLKFLDPACGSGNFLTETYLSIRKIENKIIQLRRNGQMAFVDELTSPIQVSIGQFYGIEINDFAVTVAKTALWIAESQMMHETEDILLMNLEFLPLKSYANIVEGNALRIDWNEIVHASELNYIMGNPPFIGNSRLDDVQKQDRDTIFCGNGGELDYVCCWYKKASEYINNTNIRCAFVSTNSICQGQQVAPLWKPLFVEGLHIDFAYKTFIWDSEATLKAHVYCIIVGFSKAKGSKVLLFDRDTKQEVNHINGYLMPVDDIFVEKRSKSICDSPIVIKGFQPTDNGYLILNDDSEKDELLAKEPNAKKWIRPFISAREFIYQKNRWCLWMVGISPAELNAMPSVKARVTACREWRLQQKESGDAYKLKDVPHLMRQNSKFKEGNFIVMPRVSGERRRYIPFGFVEKGAIPSDSIMLALDADLYHFGVLCSNVHMAWTRSVCGRLKGDYRYSSDIVYNNFPWCNPTDEQRLKIEQTAQGIINARALYPDSSLADLYDEVAMPSELRKAHQLNDKAVMQAYGFPIKGFTEADCVAELMKLYQRLAQKEK